MNDASPAGHLAPPATGTGPGVLVLHAWCGLNDTMRAICDRLAGEGHVAFAPDLDHGRLAPTIEEAEALSGTLDSDRVRTDLAAATRVLGERAEGESGAVGVVGFSLGAAHALGLSVEDPDHVRAVVIFYGTWTRDFEGSRAAHLGHFAEADPFEPPADVRALEQALMAAGRPVQFPQYEGTGHWFFEPDRPDAYHPAAAQSAWERTMAFLEDHLPADPKRIADPGR
jgi:carboxymethylenebutenolidase